MTKLRDGTEIVEIGTPIAEPTDEKAYLDSLSPEDRELHLWLQQMGLDPDKMEFPLPEESDDLEADFIKEKQAYPILNRCKIFLGLMIWRSGYRQLKPYIMRKKRIN